MVRSRLRTGGVATALVIPLSAVVATPARAASSVPSPQASSCDRVRDEDVFRRVRNKDAALARLVRARAMLRIALHGVGQSTAPVTCLSKVQQDGSIEATMDAAAHRVLTEIFENAEVAGGNRGIDFGPDLTCGPDQTLFRLLGQYIEGGKTDGVKIDDLTIAIRAGGGSADDPSHIEGVEPRAWRQAGSEDSGQLVAAQPARHDLLDSAAHARRIHLLRGEQPRIRPVGGVRPGDAGHADRRTDLCSFLPGRCRGAGKPLDHRCRPAEGTEADRGAVRSRRDNTGRSHRSTAVRSACGIARSDSARPTLIRPPGRCRSTVACPPGRATAAGRATGSHRRSPPMSPAMRPSPPRGRR